MKIIGTFDLNGRVLMTFEKNAVNPDDVRSAFTEAYDLFRKQYPELNLYDGVTVKWDRG